MFFFMFTHYVSVLFEPQALDRGLHPYKVHKHNHLSSDLRDHDACGHGNRHTRAY